MSILIKGMEMPERCWDCKFHDDSDDCIILGESCMTVWGEIKRLDNCPLVPVPPHGDLIDRDALIKSDRMVGKLMMYGGEYVYTQAEIDRAPTIIPADKEGE